jgi:hypothetical protein
MFFIALRTSITVEQQNSCKAKGIAQLYRIALVSVKSLNLCWKKELNILPLRIQIVLA